VTQPLMLLIVDTDTAVGKTWTGCALARALRRTSDPEVASQHLKEVTQWL